MMEPLERYQAKFDELNLLVDDIITATDKREAVEKFNDLLIDAYIEGISGVGYMLGEDIAVNGRQMDDAVNKEYDGQTIQEKLAEYYGTSDINRIQDLVSSEWHRVYGEAQYNGASATGRDIEKVWVTVGDDKVRYEHDLLDGVSAPLDGYFYSDDGDFALYPGGFSSARLNANCRCWLEYREI